MNIYKVLFILALVISNLKADAQKKVYDVNLKTETYTFGVGVGLTVIGEILKRSTKRPTETEINLLSKQDVARFDRWATRTNSQSAKSISDIILYSSISIPIISYFSLECRNNEFDIVILGIETLLINNGIANVFKGGIQRLRPSAYNENFELASKLTRGTRHSFISGHASNSAAMSFFAARVFTDLYPDLGNKKIIWTAAALVPASVSYLRVRSGKHFPTDVIAGYAVGALIGYFVPAMHKNDNLKLNLSPLGGFSMILKF